jgi:tetratricopeptide (TPR) repeat protein
VTNDIDVMNKKIYVVLLIIFFGLTAFVVIKYKLHNKYIVSYTLKERKGAAALLPEWLLVKSNGEKLFRRVTEKPEDIKATIALASLYIQEARITGDYEYYDAAAMKYIEDVLAIQPQNFEALILKAVIQLSQHHFSDAIETANIAQKINPYNAFVYGIMVDGNVEMGNYSEAVKNSDKMISIRPDIRSYSRVAYLREIHGDYPGAIEAMKMAVGAGGYGDEGTEWARVQLGHLYENTGDLKSAEMHYTIVLDERPGFGYALAGLGHVAIGNKEYAKALKLYLQADSAISDYAIKEQIAELYLLMGEKEKATGIIETIIKELSGSSAAGVQKLNHHADKELAYVYLLKNDFKNGLKHALLEYNMRPDNIDVNEAVAWAYFKNGDNQKAVPYIEKALSTNSKNPTLLCHAGAIYAGTGEREKAKILLNNTLKSDPNINPELKQQSKELLRSLK